jgi:hypothetical protein
MTTDEGVPRDKAALIRELEAWGRRLAGHRGLDEARVLGVVHRGLELSTRHGEAISHSVLGQFQAALDVLPSDRAFQIFENDDLVGLVAMAPYASYFANPETPFYTFAEFAALLAQFRSFLREHAKAILDQGEAPVRFGEARWLDRRLSRLYYTRISTPAALKGAQRGEVEELDVWRVREELWERAHDKNTGALRLDPSDAARLVAGRTKMHELRLNVLTQLEKALRRENHEELWPDCLQLMNGAMAAEEVAFYLRMDRFYRGEDAVKDGLLDEPSPVRHAALPGGLSDVLEVIGYCECELQFGAMNQAKRDVVALAEESGLSDWRDVLGRTYFDVVDKPWRPRLDEIFSRFVEREIRVAASGFWSSFRDRLLDSVSTKLIWAQADPLPLRREVERLLARIARGAGASSPTVREAAEGLPKELVDPGDVPEAVSENVFQRDGKAWRVRFSGIEKLVPHLKGMSYLAYLLERPHEFIDVVDLVHEFDSPDAGEPTARPRTAGADRTMPRTKGTRRRRREDLVRGHEDQARDAVKAAVRRARLAIRGVHPELDAHLRAVTISYKCSYNPSATTAPWNRPGIRSRSRLRPT